MRIVFNKRLYPAGVLRALLPAITALLLGCGEPSRLPATPPPTAPITEIPGDDGRPLLRVVDGALPDLAGKRIELPAGRTTFLIRHEGEEPAADDPPKTALWLRGHGEARHLLPSFGSRPLRIATMEDWSVDLPAGVYDLSVTLGPAVPPAPPAVLVVR